MWHKNKKRTTKPEFEHMAEVKKLGCLPCRKNAARGLPTTGLAVEFNHHIHAGKRISNCAGSGECIWHHRGDPRDGWTKAAMLQAFGPARNYQGGKGAFAEAYGTDLEMRSETNDLLEQRRNIYG